MSTPCCAGNRLADPSAATTSAGQCQPAQSTDRIKHATECFELFLNIVLLALELGDGELGGISVCDGRRGRPRGDGGRVESIHGSNVRCKPIPDQKRPMSSSSWELVRFKTCGAATIEARNADEAAAISLPQMTRSVTAAGTSRPWHAPRGVALSEPRGCERAASQPIGEGLQPGDVPFRRYTVIRQGSIPGASTGQGPIPIQSTLPQQSRHCCGTMELSQVVLLHSVAALIVPARDSTMDAMLKIRVRI